MDGNGLHYAPQGNHYPNHPSSLGQSHSRSNATPPPQMAGRRLSRSSNPTITTTSRFQPGGAASNPAGAPYQAHNHPQQQPTFAPHGGPPPADPHAYYQPPPPAQLPTFGPGPLPLFPTIATNRQVSGQEARVACAPFVSPLLPLFPGRHPFIRCIRPTNKTDNVSTSLSASPKRCIRRTLRVSERASRRLCSPSSL